jgi:hypothetical protein
LAKVIFRADIGCVGGWRLSEDSEYDIDVWNTFSDEEKEQIVAEWANEQIQPGWSYEVVDG